MEEKELNLLLENQSWGGSGIEKCTFMNILNIIPIGSTMLELGSGHVSTKIFSKLYKLYTIEQNINFMNLYDAEYIHAPIVDDWYDTEILKKKLPKQYDVVFVDGPTEVNSNINEQIGIRKNLIKHLNIFNIDAIWIFHDSNRKNEYDTIENFKKLTGKSVEYHECCQNNTCDYFAILK